MVFSEPRAGVGVEPLEGSLFGDAHLALLQHGRRRHHQRELVERPRVVIQHRQHGALAVAHQHHLARFVEQTGVCLAGVKAAERTGMRAGDAQCDAGSGEQGADEGMGLTAYAGSGGAHGLSWVRDEQVVTSQDGKRG